MKQLSTSALAKQRDIDSKELFKDLSSRGWIYKKDDQWHLTKEGKMAGGEMKYNPKFGEYVVWPSNLDFNKQVKSADNNFNLIELKDKDIETIDGRST